MKLKFEESQIVYQDNHLLIIDKKAGQLVQADKTGDSCLLDEIKYYLKIKYHKTGNVFLGLVHRIDRPTSGLVIFAKTSKALTRLTEMIKKKEIKKTYWTISKKSIIPSEQTLIHYLKKNEKNNKSTVYEKEIEGSKKSILSYKILQTFDRYLLLEVNLETGRHHQIRAQLSKIGIPIKGDVKYGFERTNPDASIDLNARKLAFIHPVSKEFIQVESKLPSTGLWEKIQITN